MFFDLPIPDSKPGLRQREDVKGKLRQRYVVAALLAMLLIALLIDWSGSVLVHELVDILLVALVCVLVALLIRSNAEQATLRNLLEHDALTGLGNRARLTAAFTRARRKSLAHGRPVSLVMIDIDRFKKINDDWGHPSGDLVLQALAHVCLAAVRAVDTVTRVGGEEFAILMPDASLEEAKATAERLRLALSECACAPAPDSARATFPIRFTASFGVAEMARDSIANLDHLVAVADARLYQAKDRGRNMVV